MRVVPLAMLPGFDESPSAVQGTVVNISKGGVCIRTDAPLPVSRPVRGEISLQAEVAVGLPVLMQVRWNQKCSAENQYLNGLQFLV